MSSSSDELLIAKDKSKKSVRFTSQKDEPSKEDIEKEEEDLRKSSERFRTPKSISPKFDQSGATESEVPVARTKPKKLEFIDIVAVAVKKQGKKQEILKKVSGVARPGQLTFIMGSSGAGKTTLLNILTGRNLKNIDTDGEITVNGRHMVASEMKKLSAYVQQDDVFIGMLTVKETLQFAARLRSPKKLSSIQLDDIVDDLLVMILTDPPILFCDEPTSGLDSFMSHQVIKALRNLTNEGKTVICTIHQPSTSVYNMADSLILLSQGHIAYQGSAKNVNEFFERCGYPIPKFVSSPDHFMKVISIRPNEEEKDYDERILKIVHENLESRLDSTYSSSRRSLRKDDKEGDLVTFPRTWFCQFSYCFIRSLVQILRSKGMLVIKLIQTLLLAFLIGGVYRNLPIDAEHLFNFKGFTFICVQMMHMLFMTPAMTIFWKEYPVIVREYQANMYCPSAYFLAKTTADTIQYAIYPFIFGIIVLAMTDLPNNPVAITHYFAISVLLSINASAIAQAIVSFVGDLGTAITVLPIVALPLMTFGGFLISFDAIPTYFKPLSYLSWYKYGFEAIIMAYFEDLGDIPGCDRNMTSSMDIECSTGEKFIEDLSIWPRNISLNYLFIVLTIVFWRLIGVLSFSRRIRKC